MFFLASLSGKNICFSLDSGKFYLFQGIVWKFVCLNSAPTLEREKGMFLHRK